jgi:hypothetical protein
MPSPTDAFVPVSPALNRKCIVRRKQAAQLRGESEDSVKRHLAGKEVRLGERAIGYRLEDVLQLPPEPSEA